MIKPLIEPLAESYLEVFGMVVSQREFYGLRDFYRFDKNETNYFMFLLNIDQHSLCPFLGKSI